MRILDGRPVFQGGKDHSSHRLALLGLRARKAVLVIYGLCALLGVSAAAVWRMSFKAGMAVICSVAVGLIALGIRLSFVNTGRFGRKRGVSADEKI
jgi:UDP-GlcNAc:undecaprenyl-phosphate GlcNAc-1-phosphate transferase